MKTINFSNKFAVGKFIVAIKDFTSGSIKVCTGDKGIINKITIESFPDIGLFSIRILYMDFKKYKLSMGEEVAKQYFNII